MALYNGEKLVDQLSSCHDLHTADGESVLKTTAIGDVVYLTRERVDPRQESD